MSNNPSDNKNGERLTTGEKFLAAAVAVGTVSVAGTAAHIAHDAVEGLKNLPKPPTGYVEKGKSGKWVDTAYVNAAASSNSQPQHIAH